MSAPPLLRPKIPAWILSRFTRWVERDALIDDLDEEYAVRLPHHGKRRIRLWYWGQIFRAVPSVAVYSLFRNAVMGKNYATLALRNIRKHKVFSVINIVGLAVGLSLCLFVLQLVSAMYSSDRFHEKKDRIYRVVSLFDDGNRSGDLAAAPLPLAYELEQLPTVETVVRIRKGFGGPAVLGDTILDVRGFYTDPDFFHVFSFELEEGDPATALSEPFSIVLTKDLAARLFGRASPIGETLSLKDTGDYTVTGVLRDISRRRSHMRFECLASTLTLESLERQQKLEPTLTDWENFYHGYVYCLLHEGGSPDLVEEAFPSIVGRHYPEGEIKYGFRLQPLTKISPGRNLGNFLSTSAVDPRTPVILFSIAFLIMLVACFNYTNLSLAKSLSRAREVGIRKALGANRRKLISQFIGEAVTYALVALVLAILFMKFLLPRFMGFMPFLTHVEASAFRLGPFSFLFAILTGILAGVVPAFFFSKFDPAAVLKDVAKIRIFSRLTLRRGLVVFQFFLSFFFIITTIVLFKQIRFEDTIDRGFRAENILNVELQGVDYDLFKQDIVNHPAIIMVSASDSVLCTGSRAITMVRTSDAVELAEIDCLMVDEDFIENMRIPLLAGRHFPERGSAAEEAYAVINARAVGRLGFDTPQEAIGGRLILRNDTSLEIIGVVRDFFSQSLSGAIYPMVLRIGPEYFGYANIRIRENAAEPVLEYLGDVWKKHDPYHPFRFGFLEDQIEEYQAEGKNLLRGVSFIAFLTILIAFFGLLGMVIYDTEARVKEIGIRKVMGASVLDIVLVLSRSFVVLLVLAAALAAPLAWFINHIMLQSAVNRIRLGIDIFGLGLVFMLALGVATIFSQTVRAAAGSPVESLRYE